MLLERYDNYKDSGVEWLGEIPAEWDVKRVKDTGKIYNGSTPKSENLSFWDGDIIWITPKDISKNELISDSSRKITDKGYSSCGTFLTPPKSIILTCRAPIGNISVTKTETCTNQGCKTIVLNNANYKYLYYLLLSNNLELKALGTGTTFFELSTSELKSFLLQLPLIQLQKRIANFLDKKTSQIDQKIKLLKEKTSSYEELKKSLINETVCRGLDKDVELKDSGVEWIGKIPKGWDVERLKDIGFIYSGLSGKSKEDFDKENNVNNKKFIPFTNIANNKYINLKQLRNVVINPKESQNKIKTLDLFFLMSSEGYEDIGKSSLLLSQVNSEIYLNSFCKGFRITQKKNARFINYLLNAEIFRRLMIIQGKGFTRINLKIGKILGFEFISPLPQQQTAIANYLDEKTFKIDTIITKLKNQVTTLTEFRKTLINDIVTGKIKVPQ
jgi:type I restriction enzyme, S subunit